VSSPNPEDGLEQWREMVRGLPEQVEHPYKPGSVNEAVPLYEGPFRLRQDGEAVDGEGELEYRWLPEPHVHVQGHIRASASLPPRAAEGVLEVRPLDVEARCLVGSVSHGSGPGGTEFEGGLLGASWAGSSESMDEVIFLLSNFSSYHGTTVRTADDGVNTGRLTMEAGGWLLEVDQHTDARDVRKALRMEGGYGVGHVGRLAREDRATFDRGQADDMLGLLHFLFSFARGFRCGPVLSVGLSDGERVCERWTRPNVSRWTGLRSWFPTVELDDLPHLLHGFRGRWTAPVWRRPLRMAIHWYCAANENEGALEGSLVLAQTALELLTWTYFEEEGTPEQLEAVDREAAFRSFERLLDELDIPVDVPVSPPELRTLAAMIRDESDTSIRSGPELITRVRNWVVHPTERRRRLLEQVPPPSRRAVRELALWYVELLLLRLLAYDGHYVNRLGQPAVRMGSDELVPWSDEQR